MNQSAEVPNKRLVVVGPRKAEFQETRVPRCPPDGLIVKARMTAVSVGTELRLYRSGLPDEERPATESAMVKEPSEVGHSMVGEIVEIGQEVNDARVGDRVFVPAPHKRFVAVDHTVAIKLPDALPDEQAAFLNLIELSHTALRRGSPGLGENVAIIGQGVIGLTALAYCHAFGFRTVMIDTSEERLSVAMRMGVGLAISPGRPSYLDEINDFFGGVGADVVIDAASVWFARQTALEVVRPHGKIVAVARLTGDLPPSNTGTPYEEKDVKTLSSYGYDPPHMRWNRQRSIELTLTLLTEGRLDISPIITHKFDYDELPQIYQRLDKGDPDLVGIVINWL